MDGLSILMLCVQLIGSLALFLFGMKYMSEALQRVAGQGLRNVLSRFTSNRFKAVFTGTFVTTAIQSSSATTVMVVSFVNAGLLKLSNAIGVIMGSNIGTTVTAWIITLFGIKYDIPSVPVIGVGFLMMMMKPEKLKHFGEFCVGFGLLFLGLTSLKGNIEDLDLAHNQEFLNLFTGIVTDTNNVGYGYIFLFVLIGTILTIVLQSSSAMMALTIVLCAQGAIPFEISVALVLGENIGTTITANIAAIVGNYSAKRAARSHLIFNLIGVVWMLCVFHPYLKGINFLTIQMDGQSPYETFAAIPIALSLFHTTFNILNTSLLIWFIPQIEKLTTFMVKRTANEDDEIFKLEYIDSGFMKVGELAVESANKEVQLFGQKMAKMFEFIPRFLEMDVNDKDYDNLLSRIRRYEEQSDKLEIDIANYLAKASTDGIAPATNLRIAAILSIVDNLESIGDQNYQMAKLIENKNETKTNLTPEMTEHIQKMFDLVRNALVIMQNNLESPYKTGKIDKALEAENAINTYRNQLRNEHLTDIKNNVYTYHQGIIYSGLYALLEKLGDHIINISEVWMGDKVTNDENII